MSEMVDRVALALCRYETELTSSASHEANHNYPPYWEGAAHVAIAAMREPTEAMWKANQPIWSLGRPMWEWWKAMIDESIK